MRQHHVIELRLKPHIIFMLHHHNHLETKDELHHWRRELPQSIVSIYSTTRGGAQLLVIDDNDGGGACFLPADSALSTES